MSDAWTNMGVMTTPETPGHKLSFRISADDKKALESLMLLVPSMEEGRSIVLRAALRLGMAELAKDPSKILTVRTPEISPKRPRER